MYIREWVINSFVSTPCFLLLASRHPHRVSDGMTQVLGESYEGGSKGLVRTQQLLGQILPIQENSLNL